MGARPSLAMETFIDAGTKGKTRLMIRMKRGRVFGIYFFVCDRDMALMPLPGFLARLAKDN